MKKRTSRPQVLILTSPQLFPHFFPPRTIEQLGRFADWTLETERKDTPGLRASLAQAEGLLTTWHSPFLTRQLLGDPPCVKIIAHCGGEIRARMEDRLLDTILVTNAPEPMARPVAEMALTMVLSLVRRLADYERQMREGHLHTNEFAPEGETLIGRTVGVIGFGRIGQAFARMIRPFGVRLLVADPYCRQDVLARHRAKSVQPDELVQKADIVVLTAALTDETRHIIDRRRLAFFRPGACLVNVGRGGLIDLAALTNVLRKGELRAALDVTDPLEPLPAGHELRRLPNVLLTPHIAAGGVEVRRAMGETAVAELRRFFAGSGVRNRVTLEMLARMT